MAYQPHYTVAMITKLTIVAICAQLMEILQTLYRSDVQGDLLEEVALIQDIKRSDMVACALHDIQKSPENHIFPPEISSSHHRILAKKKQPPKNFFFC